MENMTQLRSVTCHIRSVTFYPTQVNTPRLHRISQTNWYSIYRPFKDGGLSKPRRRVQGATRQPVDSETRTPT